MSFDKKQITDFTERILKRSGMYSHEALDQMLKTLAQESHFGTYLYKPGRDRQPSSRDLRSVAVNPRICLPASLVIMGLM